MGGVCVSCGWSIKPLLPLLLLLSCTGMAVVPQAMAPMAPTPATPTAPAGAATTSTMWSLKPSRASRLLPGCPPATGVAHQAHMVVEVVVARAAVLWVGSSTSPQTCCCSCPSPGALLLVIVWCSVCAWQYTCYIVRG